MTVKQRVGITIRNSSIWRRQKVRLAHEDGFVVVSVKRHVDGVTHGVRGALVLCVLCEAPDVASRIHGSPRHDRRPQTRVVDGALQVDVCTHTCPVLLRDVVLAYRVTIWNVFLKSDSEV